MQLTHAVTLFRRDAALWCAVRVTPRVAAALPTSPLATIFTPPTRFIMPPRGICLKKWRKKMGMM
jgi:hypothetical protein